MAETCEVAAWLKALPCAPEFRPSEAEFADPIAYISKIEAEARTYGICKIVPPYTRASKKTVMANLNRSLLLQSPDSASSAAVHGTPATHSEPELCRSMGGCMPPQVGRRSMSGCFPSSQPRTRSMPLPSSNDAGDLKARFNTRRQQLGCSSGKRSKVPVQTLAQKLVWQSGESYTLEQFEAKARQFTRARLKTSRDLPPYVIESLFWKAAADRTITVEYGNDIPGSAFGEPSQQANTTPTTTTKRKRGLEEEDHLQHPLKEPKLEGIEEDPGPQQGTDDSSSLLRSLETASNSGTSSRAKLSSPFSAKERSRPCRKNGPADGEGRAGSKLANSCWNMKVMARSPGSLLRYMPDEVPGVTSPMVYIGMLFSWFAWHVEDHELHSLNYLHTGAPKTWYAVPGDAAPALEEVVRVYGYGNISDPKAAFALLGEKTTVMSPEVLLAAGVPCCRLVQNAGEFVVTFPRAYHLGFSHGFNCGEAANFASPAWLEVAKEAATRRAAMDYLPMLSHQQLLYLLALSFCPRIPFSLPCESQILGLKDSEHSSGEDAVKAVFTNDVAHNNRLLGLLVDSGVTGCVLLGDGADLTPALSEHFNKLSRLGVDSDLKTSSFMCDLLLEEVARETKTVKEDVAASPKEQEFSKSPTKTRDMLTITNFPFRWGTLPCAACGLLCFPSMAVVQPVSNIENDLYPAKHLNIGASGHLSSFFREEEDHAPDSGHLPSFLTKNDEDLQSEYLKTPLAEAVYHPVASLAEQKKFLQWEAEQVAIQALHKNSQDDETLSQSLQAFQADQKYNVCEQNEISCSNGKLLDHLHREIRKTNVLQQDIEKTQEFINNCEEEMPHEDVITQDSTDLDSSKIGSVLLEDEALHKESAGNVDSTHFSNADSLEDIAEGGAVTGNMESRSSGSLFQSCKDSPILDNLLLLHEAGARNVEHDAETSVLQLLAVTYQDESEDSGLPDSNIKFAVAEAEHGGICFHPHSSLVSDDEVGCTVDAPWHCVKDEGECALSLGCVDKLLTDNCSLATPSNELDKFVCKEVLLQSDDGTYVITERMPKVEAGLLVHNDQCCRLQSSKSDSKDASTASQVGSVSLGFQKEESTLSLEGGQACPDMPYMSLGKRESFIDSEKAESQVYKEPSVSKEDCDGESKEIVFSIPTTETSAKPHYSCNPCSDKVMNQSNSLESSRQTEKLRTKSDLVELPTNGLNADDFGQACLFGIGNTLATDEIMEAESQCVTDEINKAENQIEDDRIDCETMCKASSLVEKRFPPDFVKNRLHAQLAPSNPVANCSINLNWMQGEQRDQSKFSLIEARSTLYMGIDKLIREQDNRMKREVEDLCATNAEILKIPASIGEPLGNESSDNHLESSSSNTSPRPHFLCLEHALEARHQLNLLGGSYMVIICHSDISKIEDHAQHFSEELNLSHSWRCIPFKEANQEEKDLINTALNMEEEGEGSSKDWVVQLGMSVRHCREKVWSNHSNDLCREHDTDISCKEKAGSVCTVNDVRENHAVGKVLKQKKSSVAGRWCGKVWMDNQIHPVLGGCYTVPTLLQAFHLSLEDNALNEKTSSPEQICNGDIKDVGEGVKVTCRTINDVDTGLNPQCNSVPQRTNKKRKSIDQTSTLLKGESDCAMEEHGEIKRRELRADTATLDTSCLTSAIKKDSIYLNEIANLDNQTAGKKFYTMESNVCTATEITNTKAGNNHVSDATVIDHDGSDVDIWQDLDVGCYSQEVLSLDNIAGVTDTLMVDTCHQMDAESQENLLIPGMLRRRSCSVFDGEAQSQSLGRERDCAVSAFAECTIGEALHAVLEPSISEGLDYTMGLKRKQDNQIDITNKRTKERNFNPLDISNLTTADFGHSTLESEQGIPFFEPSRNFNVGLVGEENGGAECMRTDSIPPGKVQMPHRNTKQEYPREVGQFASVPPYEILTRNLGRMNSDSSSGSTQWRLHTAQNSLTLVKCKSKKLAGKQVNWEKSRKDPLNQSLRATESSDEDIVHKRTLPKGRKKIILDDLPFDCADFFTEGPSTRLRSRRVAKALSMDDDDVVDGRHDDAIIRSGKKHKQPRQRAKKPIVKDIEDECGAYICELDGCSMSFSSKQELNLHKRNTCTFTGCGKRFGSHKYLLQHRRVHLDDRPLKCPWNGCKMTFKWKWACTEHYRVHTGERPYVCPIPECGRTFRFVSDFSRHKRKTGHTK